LSRLLRIVAVIGVIFGSSFFGFPDSAAALPTNGINAQIYYCPQYGAQPPRPCNSQPVATTTVNQINYNWGGGSVLGSYGDRVEVKFTGYIMSPTTVNATFQVGGDDGQYLNFNNTNIITNCWWDKGGGNCQSQPIILQANTAYPFTYWFYENGGGANTYFWWNIGSGFQIVPSNVFYLTEPTPPPSLNSPTSLSGTIQPDGINLSWAAPTATNANTAVERYAVSWSTSNFITNGWGIATGNVGSETALNTSITIPYDVISNDGRGKEYQFKVRADNDTLSTYSPDSNIITLYVPLAPPTISLTAGNNSIQVSASHQDANTWFYQVLTSQQGCSNPYDGQTLNTEGHPSSFTINNLQNDCLYQIKVANWTGQVNLYASATATPIYTPAPLPFTPQYTINENDTLTITASENKVIDSINAWYGDPNDGNFGLNVSSQLTQQFANAASANLSATNTVFGDPVPGVVKVLIVSITYKDAPQPEPTLTPTTTPTPTPTVTTTPEPSPSPSSPEPTTSPSPQPSPEPSPEPQTPPQPPVEPSPPSPQPPTPEPPPVRPPDPVVVPPVVEPTPEPDPQPEPEPEVPVEPEQPIDQNPIDTPDSQDDTELDPVVVPEDPTPTEDQPPVQEDPVQDNTETQDPQETMVDSQIQDDSKNTSDNITSISEDLNLSNDEKKQLNDVVKDADLSEEQIKEIAKVISDSGLSKEQVQGLVDVIENADLSKQEIKQLAELVKNDPVIAQAVEQFNERAAENANAPMPYTLADAATEVQAEQIIDGVTEAFTDPGAAAAAVGESLQKLAAFTSDLLSNPGEALASLGSDMTDDQREKVQEVIIPVIIVSQVMNAVANILSARRI